MASRKSHAEPNIISAKKALSRSKLFAIVKKQRPPPRTSFCHLFCEVIAQLKNEILCFLKTGVWTFRIISTGWGRSQQPGAGVCRVSLQTPGFAQPQARPLPGQCFARDLQASHTDRPPRIKGSIQGGRLHQLLARPLQMMGSRLYPQNLKRPDILKKGANYCI